MPSFAIASLPTLNAWTLSKSLLARPSALCECRRPGLLLVSPDAVDFSFPILCCLVEQVLVFVVKVWKNCAFEDTMSQSIMQPSCAMRQAAGRASQPAAFSGIKVRPFERQRAPRMAGPLRKHSRKSTIVQAKEMEIVIKADEVSMSHNLFSLRASCILRLSSHGHDILLHFAVV